MHQITKSLKAIEGLEPQRLWRYFYEISCIPRESGNEEGIRNYLLDFAKEHGFESHTDSVGNVIFRTKATKGYEDRPSVALQGHMDMVCVKEEGIQHDFLKDPLTLQRTGDNLSAVGTTLGADNGIAIALILDLFTDPSAQHGPLEAIITVAEETGLNGAFGLDPSQIHSRKMLNLDSEEEGVFYIGCAGGNEVDATLDVEEEPVPDDYIQMDLLVDGLQGGHSGADADQQRANSIVCTMRYLHALNKATPVMIARIDGGTKRNVIPSVCKTTILLPAKNQHIAESLAIRVMEELRGEYSVSDPKVRISLTPQKKSFDRAPSREQTRKLINAVFITPNGVDKMSMTIEGLVETSSNLAVIALKEKVFSVITSHRSSVLSSRDNIAHRAETALASSGASTQIVNSYPAWTPDIHSPLAKFCADAWKTHTGTEAKITAIHAGLECGIVNSLVPGMDSVSLGPNLNGVHSTEEVLSIGSTARIAGFIRHLLTCIS